MTSTEIIDSWKKKKEFKPIYWLEGPEEFFIDEVINYAEHHLLSEDQAAFNLSVFYGRDTDWTDVMNACRRYPVFSDKQVVLIKEAQNMRTIEKLSSYAEAPGSSTILVVGYKGKTLDGRKKFAKAIKTNGVLFTTKKVYDNQLPAWTQNYVASKGLEISAKGLSLLVNHVGNDLSRLTNEINKLSINLGDRKEITEDDIETYVGISKEYNIFELQAAISFKNRSRALSIIQYMASNPKALPIQLVTMSLYGYFSKLMLITQKKDKSENTLREYFYNNPTAVKQAQTALKNYSFSDLENGVMLLHHYNLKTIGIGSYNTPPASLMKELVFKIIQ